MRALFLLLALPSLAADEGAPLEVVRLDATSPEEARAHAEEVVAEIHGAFKQLGTEVGRERSLDHPELRIQVCLEDRHRSLRSIWLVSQQARTGLSQALEAGDGPLAEHELRRLTTARDLTRRVVAEAELCRAPEPGPEVYPVDVCAELGWCEDETAALPVDVDFGADPPEASPFQ